MFVGEIGLPRREFLYVIQFWEARRILQGYNKRERSMWSAIRWQTFHILASFSGTEQMIKNGWNQPTDLLPFPWEKEPAPPMTDEEVLDMQADIKNFQDFLRNGQNHT